MKSRTIKAANNWTVKITVKETGDNYNQFASIFMADNTSPYFGTFFKNTATNKEIKMWANERINAPHNVNLLN